MQEPFVVDVKKLAGRRIVIDLPEAPKRSYICCNTGDWSVNVDATNLPVEKEFLWNFEQGKRVIYTSMITRIAPGTPAEIDFRMPIWNIHESNVIINDKTFKPAGEFVHDYVIGEVKKVRLTKLIAEGSFLMPAVIFSGKVNNGFGVNIELYMEAGTSVYTIWEKSIKLSEKDNFKKAKYKGKDYFVWDTQIEDAFNICTGLLYEVDAETGVNLGVSVRMNSSDETFIGQKEDINAFIFKLSNFHYILQFSDI